MVSASAEFIRQQNIITKHLSRLESRSHSEAPRPKVGASKIFQEISSPPWRLSHNSPNPSFRTRPPKAGEIRNPVKVRYIHTLPGSRLASRFARLGRDDEL